MTKKSKLKTPDWILKGEVKDTKSKKKLFFKKVCPSCGSSKLKVVIGEVGFWKCESCDYKGKKINKKEISEDEF